MVASNRFLAYNRRSGAAPFAPAIGIVGSSGDVGVVDVARYRQRVS
jgi:hypothetical protein